MNEIEWMKRRNQLRDVLKISCSDGNWNANEYLMGMANGLILAEAILENKEPKYFTKPDVWLSDIKLGVTETSEKPKS